MLAFSNFVSLTEHLDDAKSASRSQAIQRQGGDKKKTWYKINPKESNQKLPPILAYVYV